MAANEYAQEALIEALMSEKSRALDDLDQGLKISSSPSIVLTAAAVFALVGDDARAMKMSDEVAKQRPYDTQVQDVSVPFLKALIEFNHGKHR